MGALRTTCRGTLRRICTGALRRTCRGTVGLGGAQSAAEAYTHSLIHSLITSHSIAHHSRGGGTIVEGGWEREAQTHGWHCLPSNSMAPSFTHRSFPRVSTPFLTSRLGVSVLLRLLEHFNHTLQQSHQNPQVNVFKARMSGL